MSDKQAGSQRSQSVVAIAQADSQLRAVELRRNAAQFEILWTKTGKDKEADWVRFATDCGLSLEPVEPTEGNGRQKIVAGFGSAGVVFNKVEVPVGARAQAASIVRLQAESRLPLSLDQMELAWREGHTTNGQVPVTMAAARTEHIEAFLANVRDLTPAKILLDSEAIVKVWQTLFGGDDHLAVIVSVGPDNAQLCLAQDDQLVNSVVLDIGADDFSAGTAQTEVTERFIRDTRGVLNLFGFSDPAKVPLIVLSDGGDAIRAMVGGLALAGLNAREALPNIARIAEQSQLDADVVYKYRVPIGLAVIALEDHTDNLNIFERLYEPSGGKHEKPWFSSLAMAVATAVAVLVVFALVSYAVDKAKPGAIDKRIKAVLADSEMKELLDRQGLRQAIAAQRPDVLQIIKLVSEIGQGGIKLDGVDFKKGQLASVSGTSPGYDQIYKFEKDLNANKYIKDAKIHSHSVDAKSKKSKFTITFKYRTFSEKKRR